MGIRRADVIEGVIFDLDGTITRPLLDFARIRREISADDGPVWEYIQSLPRLRRARAEAVLVHHELEAARAAELNAGAGELVDWLESKGIRTALVTRNCRQSVEIVCQRFNLAFDLIVTREDAPVKPSPEPIFLVSRVLGIRTGRLLIVGDYHFDILAGKAAGAVTCFLTNGKRASRNPVSDHVISSLFELQKVINP
jgi:HAD superfamily hydrolase (TIGR01509 family)